MVHESPNGQNNRQTEIQFSQNEFLSELKKKQNKII